MTLRVFRNYWQRPMAVLAGMEVLVFAAALCLISLPHFDGESPLAEPRLAEVLSRALLFAPVLSISMVATGLYNERQAFALGGLLTRIVVSTLVPAAAQAACSGSQSRWKRRTLSGRNGPGVWTWYVKIGAPIATTTSCPARIRAI